MFTFASSHLMFKHLKIKIALFICLAFVLRIALTNFNFISDLSLSKDLSSKSIFSKKTKHTEVDATPNANKYTLVDVFEEDSDNEEDETKVKSPILLFIVHSFIQHTFFSPSSNSSFAQIKCELFSKRYLSLSILRI